MPRLLKRCIRHRRDHARSIQNNRLQTKATRTRDQVGRQNRHRVRRWPVSAVFNRAAAIITGFARGLAIGTASPSDQSNRFHRAMLGCGHPQRQQQQTKIWEKTAHDSFDSFRRESIVKRCLGIDRTFHFGARPPPAGGCSCQPTKSSARFGKSRANRRRYRNTSFFEQRDDRLCESYSFLIYSGVFCEEVITARSNQRDAVRGNDVR